jgi:hypothetical protein
MAGMIASIGHRLIYGSFDVGGGLSTGQTARVVDPDSLLSNIVGMKSFNLEIVDTPPQIGILAVVDVQIRIALLPIADICTDSDLAIPQIFHKLAHEE